MTTATIIGLGTIGSAVASLVARMPRISGVTLVDPDAYAEANLSTQAIDSSAPGRPKVEVQAALIHAINPLIEVEAIEERVENVPLAILRSSVLVSCVDNRRARQSINRIAWRCGSPWIDAAVDAASLVRISAYTPSHSAPCLECAWDQASYELLEQEYPCDAGGVSAPATEAPAELGALAASLQAAELRKLLGGATNGATLVGAQVMLDTATHARHLSRFERNEQCRFDHESWEIDTVDLEPQENTLRDLFDAVDPGPDQTVKLEGHSFATYVDCVACGRRSSVGLSLYRRLSAADRICSCGGRMFATGFFSFEAIRRSELSGMNLGLKLAALGFQAGEVISVADASGSEHHLEIGGGAAH